MTFGQKIQNLRISKGFTQEQMAEYLGIGRSTLANYEQGVREPDFDFLRTISRLYQVSIDELLMDDESYEKNKKRSFISIEPKSVLGYIKEEENVDVLIAIKTLLDAKINYLYAINSIK